MGLNKDLCNFLEISLKGWSFTRLHSNRNFEGIITGWRDNVIVTNSFFVCSGMLIEVFSKGVNKSFKVLNVYGPYEEKRCFWDRIFNSSMIQGSNLIIVGELNFTLNSGDSAQMEPRMKM